jgi:hypothetical protein
MGEFLGTYGGWILLAVLFLVMGRFGGCCGGGRPGRNRPPGGTAGRAGKSAEPPTERT